MVIATGRGPAHRAKKQRSLPLMLAGAGGLAAVAIAVALLQNGPAAETPRAGDTTGVSPSPPRRSLPALRPRGRGRLDSAALRPPAPAPPVAPPLPPTPDGRRRPGRPDRDQCRRPSRTATPPPAPPPPTSRTTATCQATASGDDRDTAFRLCTDEAQKGNVVSQRLLAGLYDRSQVPGHDAEAVTWYRQAADAGDLPSLFRLGQLLHHGKGVPQNALDATAKIKSAAEADYQPGVHARWPSDTSWVSGWPAQRQQRLHLVSEGGRAGRRRRAGQGGRLADPRQRHRQG